MKTEKLCPPAYGRVTLRARYTRSFFRYKLIPPRTQGYSLTKF